MQQVQKKDVLSNKEESLMEDSDERMDTSNIKLEDL